MSAAACDIAVIVDDGSNSDCYANFISYIANHNIDAKIVKLSPNYLRFDEESMEKLVELLHTKTNPTEVKITKLSNRRDVVDVFLSATAAHRLARGYPSLDMIKLHNALVKISAAESKQDSKEADPNEPYSLLKVLCQSGVLCAPNIIPNTFKTVHFTPTSIGIEHWDLHYLIKLMQAVFSDAKIAATAITETWTPPKNRQGLTGIVRAVQLARAKVMLARQIEGGKTNFASKMEELLSKNATRFGSLGERVKTVHGSVALKSGMLLHTSEKNSKPLVWDGNSTTGAGFIEVCQGHIAVRASGTVVTGDADTEWLTIQGTLDTDDVTLLNALLKLCATFKLQPKQTLQAGDISTTQRAVIQQDSKYKDMPLPSGVWFDGQYYVDINGTKLDIRPDIDALLAKFLIEENRKIKVYNSLLADIE